MLSDAKELASDQQHDADVGVVGAGATGISIARELSGNGVSAALALRLADHIKKQLVD
jgi:glycerol-3-phosphate dehydrogenase